MNSPTSRRAFVATLATTVAGVACRSVPGMSSAPVRRLQVGHTGILWGYAPANAEGAIRDAASLGYHGFESFGSVLEFWASRGGLKRLLDASNLPLRSAYCPFELTDTSKRRATVAKAALWGRLIREAGGSIAVIGPDNVTRSTYAFGTHRTNIVAALNEIGQALADAGVLGAVHPHTGSSIQSRDEVHAVMESVDTRLVTLAPDMGELLAAGADPLQVVKDFLPLIRHAHLKDYDGGSDHDGYCAVGRGRVDMAGIVSVLEASTQELMLMVELNPSRASRVPPLEHARTSRDHLARMGYRFRSAG